MSRAALLSISILAVSTPAIAQPVVASPKQVASGGERRFDGFGLIGGAGLSMTAVSTWMANDGDDHKIGGGADVWIGTGVLEHVAVLGFATYARAHDAQLVAVGPSVRAWPLRALPRFSVEGRVGLAHLHRDRDFQSRATLGMYGRPGVDEGGWLVGGGIGYELFTGADTSIDARLTYQHAQHDNDRHDVVSVGLALTHF